MGKREYPTDPQTMQARNLYAWTEYEALQMCAPFEDPPITRNAILWIRDVIEDVADDTLTERERWIFTAVIAKQSFRSIGRDLRLSKSQTFRIYRRAIEKIRLRLSEVCPGLLDEYQKIARGDL